MKYRILMAAFIFAAITAHAQDKKNDSEEETKITLPKNIEAGFEGMLAVSYGNNTLGINVGGPSLKYKFGKKFKIGVGAFPSLIITNGKASPRLAVSPIVEYRRVMIITPYYGFDTNNNAIWTFGAGYKFL